MRRYLFCLFVVIFPLSTVNVRARNNKDQFVFIGKLQVNNYFIRDGEYTDLIKNDTTYQITNGVAVPKYGMPVKKYLNGLSKFYDENRF